MVVQQLFIWRDKHAPYLLRMLLVCALVFAGQKASCLTRDTLAPAKNIFASLAGVPQLDRVTAANSLYKGKLGLRRAPEGTTMPALDQLSALAQSLNDKALECEVFNMRADYYSVNRGFNTLSTYWYQKGIDYAVANKLPVQTGLRLHQMGLYFSNYKHNAEACRYFLKALTVFDQAGYANIPDVNVCLSQIAEFYYRLGDYDNARANLELALKYTIKDHDRINILNTIGLIYRNDRKFVQALGYFDKAKNIATGFKDTVWIGIANGNIGSVYFLQKQYQQALPYIRMDYEVSMKYQQAENGVIALLRLVKMNIDNNNLGAAQQQLQVAENYFENEKHDVLSTLTDFYELKSQLYEKQGQSAASITYRKKYEQGKDSLIKRNNIAAVERVKLRYEIDKHNDDVTKLKTDAKIRSVKTTAAFIVLALLIGIALLFNHNQRVKTKKDNELLLAEKRRVDEELKSADAALRNFTENLRQKNMLIENFKGEIERLKLLSNSNADAGRLEELLQAHIMTEDNWQDFKKLFSQVYPGFFVNLTRWHPQLSQADIRMLTLIKLGLNNSEMANMLGISVDGILKAKQRLRKKMDINALGETGQGIAAN